MRWAWLVGFMVVLAGCGDDDGARDAGSDGGADARIDATFDAGTDTGSDAAVDSGSDAGEDAGDAGVDAGEDTGVDAGEDGGVDGGDGDDAGTDAGSDSGTDSGVDAGADASLTNSGACESDADCAGDRCVELTPGGYRVCQGDTDEATACTGSGFDECCNSSECATGRCFTTPVIRVCAGILPLPSNVCATNQCIDDAGCAADQVCLPNGVLGRKVRSCMRATCRTDLDCAAGGWCMPVSEPCCGTTRQLVCVYPTDCPRTPCGGGAYCQPLTDRTECRAGFPICPA